MLRLERIAASRLERDPNIESFTVNVGGGMGSRNQAQFGLTLKPQGKRPSADDIVIELMRRMSGIPGLAFYVQNPPAIRIGGRSAKSQYQFTLRGPDITTLYAQASRFMTQLEREPMLTGVTSDLLNRSPLLKVHIDRPRALSLGVTPQAIENALANAYNQQQVSTIYTPSNEYWVVLETVPRAQRDGRALAQLYVPAAGGK